MNSLIKKLNDNEATLGVIGLGYVGLPLAVEMAKAGYRTFGFELQQTKLDAIRAGISYIADVPSEKLKSITESGLLSVTSDFSLIASVDCICICVPTPLDKHQVPDISCVRAAAESIIPCLHKDMLIVLESTTYPGTTEELLRPLFEQSGLICGEDFYLAFSPERVDPGNSIYDTNNTPKVVGGITHQCTNSAAALYEKIIDAAIHRVSSPAVAEMEKILENTYRNINIGLINELAILCHEMGINIWEVIDAARTKPYGFQAFYPGSGLGGHCIPLDPYYLSWKAREYGLHTSMIEVSMTINDGMPKYCTERVSKMLNKRKKALNGSRIVVLGVAYKQDIDDCRESPSIKVIHELEKDGAEVHYYDPYITEYNEYGATRRGELALTAELLEAADLVIIATAHTTVDYAFVQRHASLIFDTKNAMAKIKDRHNIELL